MRTHTIEPNIHAFTALVSCKINTQHTALVKYNITQHTPLVKYNITQHTPLVKYNIKTNCINITYQLAYLSTLVRGDFGIKGCRV